MKMCTKCKIKKELTEFFRDKAFKSGYYASCKQCKMATTKHYRATKREQYNAYMRNYQRNHSQIEKYKTYYRSKSYRIRYGITIEDYNRMYSEQEGKCAICLSPPKEGTYFHVDHDHKTRFVRGLLCASCNRSIAIFDQADNLKRAITYLNKSNQA